MIEKQCLLCRKFFSVKLYRKRTVKYCSNSCRVLDKQAQLAKRQCLICEKEFTIEQWKLKSSYKGIYCSTECYKARSPQKEIECVCGKKFRAHQSRASYYHRLFCSQKCYLKNGFFGRLTDDIPEVSRYGKFVARLRSTARYLQWSKGCKTRDKEICTSCRSTNNLTVHHKVGIYDLVRRHGLNQKKIEADPIFFDVDNGKTVCRSCHLARHRRKDE